MGAIRLALLLCDTPVPSVRSVYGTYVEIFRHLLEASLNQAVVPHPEWTLDGYDVVKGHYPSEEALSQYHGILISGSAASAYAPLEWIPPLLQFLSRTATLYPQVKIIGICFGLQLIARAFGGECVPNEKGWELGVHEVDLTTAGKLIFGQDKLRIHQVHRDHVPSLPPKFHLLGSTDKCLVQGIVLPYGSVAEVTSFSDIHILCLQGHPEFNTDIVQKVVDTREASGILDAPTAQEARRRAVLEHDGVNVIGKVIWKLFGLSFLPSV